MNRETAHWRRLAEYVVQRREALGMTQQDVQAAGGPSPATLRHIEGAQRTSYKRWILRSVERALRWQHGSIEDILDGGEPALTEPRTATARERLANAIQSRIDELGLDPQIISYVVEDGVPPRGRWAEMEDELRWATGSIEAVLDGRTPKPVDHRQGDQGADGPTRAELAEKLASIQGQLADLQAEFRKLDEGGMETRDRDFS